MTFNQSLKYLEKLTVYGIKTGLNHTKIIAQELGNPQKFFPSVLIGGTNGKGSTSAYIESILRESGYKTGLFTSPHLVDVRERIRINGRLISRLLFASGISKIEEVSKKLKSSALIDESPTFFEVLTLLAFLIFKEEKVDIAVVEVGMGGKNDCTNILEPLISLVTNVSYDHQQYLGKSIKEIAKEKGGIFREGKWAIVGITSNLAVKHLREEAKRCRAKFLNLKKREIKKKENCFLLKIDGKEIAFPEPPLAGNHQIENAALAALVCDKLTESGYRISNNEIKKGIEKSRWEGRLQKLGENPLTFIDGAHNVDGIKRLKEFVKTLKGEKILVFTALKDKPIKKMVKILEPLFNEILFTKVDMKRATTREDFQRIFNKEKIIFFEEPMEALEKARKKAGKDGVVIVCGSLYLTGYILLKIKNLKKRLWGSGL